MIAEMFKLQFAAWKSGDGAEITQRSMDLRKAVQVSATQSFLMFHHVLQRLYCLTWLDSLSANANSEYQTSQAQQRKRRSTF
jgi:hypothetical protein